jgi:predicted RNA-binding protein with TRAM domain
VEKNMYGNRFDRGAPVQEGEELDVKIEALGEKGDGIAKKNGFVLVIPGTKVNDEVKIKVTKVLKKVGFAEVIGKATTKPEVSEKPARKQSEDEESDEETTEEGEESEESGSEEESEDFEGEDTEDFGDEEQ